MRRTNLGTVWGGVLLVSLVLVGCPLDTRTLRQEIIGTSHGGSAGKGGNGDAGDAAEGGVGGDSGNEGGTQNGSGGANAGDGGSSVVSGGASGSEGGGTGGASGGGTGGSGGSGGKVSDCPDLDENLRPDCDETLAMNGMFDSDAEAWVSDDGTEREWSATDAAERMNSGSVVVSNLVQLPQEGTVMAGAKQCVAVIGGGFYKFLAEVSVPGGQGGGGTGAINLLFFGNPDCTGSREGEANTSAMSGEADWTVVDASTQVPGRARSVLLKLVAVKPFRSTSLEAKFDNVLVRSF